MARTLVFTSIRIETPREPHEINTSLSMHLYGELYDGTWAHLELYCLPKCPIQCVKLVPRLLAMWEAAASQQEQNKSIS